MKKLLTLSISCALALVPLVSCKNKDSGSNATRNKYEYVDEKKDSVYLGYYPQSKVEDEALANSLTKKAGTLPTASSLGS